MVHGVLAAVRAGGFTLAERKKRASLALRHTAEYDVAVASWMESVLAPEDGEAAASLPPWLGATFRRATVLRYGENPHQQAALYSDDGAWPGLAQGSKLDVRFVSTAASNYLTLSLGGLCDARGVKVWNSSDMDPIQHRRPRTGRARK